MSDSRLRYFVLGSGRVGATLATILDSQGRLAGCWTRSAQSAQRLSAHLSLEVTSGTIPQVADDNTVIVVAVPDRVVARVLVAHPARLAGDQRWLHVSGSLGQAVFAEAGVVGPTGIAHPLHSFSTAITSADALSGAVMAISGDPLSLPAAHTLARLLQCEPVEIPEEQGVAYHLAATLSSNGVYALLHAAGSVLAEAGIEDERLLQGMARLASQSAQSAQAGGASAMATGPAVRGDANTVRSHRRLLSDQRSDVSALYDEISLLLLDIAEQRNLSPQLLAALSAVLVERPN